MPGPEQLKPKELVVGGRYLHVNRLFIRQIDAVEGDTVIVSKPTSNVVAGQVLRRPDGRGVIRERVNAGISAATTMPHEFMHPIYRLLSPRWRSLAQQVAASWLVAGLLAPPSAVALTITAVTSGNGHPAHEVQWTDSAGQPRSAIMVDQSASGPGYLYQLTYQHNGSPRVCAGTGITGYPGDGFVENHNTAGSDNNSLDDATPGTTVMVLQGNSHAIIEYSMLTYQILGETIPTAICWFFADGRSHPIFAISQDARATGGNLGADTRSPYGSINFDGTVDGSSDIGGASYGDTLKFVTLASGPEAVTGLSGWSDNQTNTIPYAMEWINPAEVDAEMGHVATVPITVQDQGKGNDNCRTQLCRRCPAESRSVPG